MAQPPQQQPSQPKVLIAAVTKGRSETSLHFAASAMRVQTDSALRVSAHYEFGMFETLNEALNAFLKGEFAMAFFLDTWLGFPTGFLHRAMSSGAPFVVGVYPLPIIDWERVKDKSDSAETPRFRGNRYNVDTKGATPASNGYCSIESAQLGAFMLRREAIEKLATHFPSDGATTLFTAETVVDGNRLDADANVCRIWRRELGGTILADTESPFHSFGPTPYTGCVGLRTVLR